MIPTCLHVAGSTIYAGGMSYILQATALDQRVFDFVAPKFSDACAFGIAYSLMNQVLEVVARNLTHTRFESGYVPYGGHYTDMHSDHPTIYKICNAITAIISAFGSAYLLKSMNYSISYRFAAVCMLPFVVASIVKANRE